MKKILMKSSIFLFLFNFIFHLPNRWFVNENVYLLIIILKGDLLNE